MLTNTSRFAHHISSSDVWCQLFTSLHGHVHNGYNWKTYANLAPRSQQLITKSGIFTWKIDPLYIPQPTKKHWQGKDRTHCKDEDFGITTHRKQRMNTQSRVRMVERLTTRNMAYHMARTNNNIQSSSSTSHTYKPIGRQVGSLY